MRSRHCSVAQHRSDTAQFTDVHRLHEPDGTARTWEAEASLQLRSGTVAALDAYRRHGRITDVHDRADDLCRLPRVEGTALPVRTGLLVGRSSRSRRVRHPEFIA
jgi:hypothetical protein